MGQPLKMAELIASLDGPIYVERVALYDAKQRVKARRAIRKALENQLEGRGYSFVEVLSECPTHLKLSPVEAEKWVRETMEPIFPLGVKKDLSATTAPWFTGPQPSFVPEEVLGLSGAEPAAATHRHAAWPAHLPKRDLSFKFAGSGGDGAQTAALLLVRAAIELGYDATHIPAYGPESRGGTSYADVHVAAQEVLDPAAPEPDFLVAFNAPSLAKFASSVAPGGTILYDSTIIATPPTDLPVGRTVLGLPFTKIAADLGKPMVKNVVALGALHAATRLLPDDALLETLAHVLKDKAAVLPLNRAAFAAGHAAVVQPALT
jgi:2-oxoisovalerate ferredoxin oxidoreductase beta subunit